MAPPETSAPPVPPRPRPRLYVEVMKVELSAFRERGLGFVAHLLHHTLVADGHRPEYGPISEAGYMAFIEADGSLRPCHEIFNDY